MPNYTYFCELCKYLFTKFNKISDYRSREPCPNCGRTESVFRKFDDDNIYQFNRIHLSDIKKVGHYAERNTKKRGKYELEDMRKSFKTEKTDTRPLPDGFSPMTKEEYIKAPRKKTRKRGDIK